MVNIIMQSEIGIIIAYGAGLFLIFFFGKLLVAPMKLIIKLIFNSIVGALIIVTVNLMGCVFGSWDFSCFDLFDLGWFSCGFAGEGPILPLNMWTAFITGMLGVPGVILLWIVL